MLFKDILLVYAVLFSWISEVPGGENSILPLFDLFCREHAERLPGFASPRFRRKPTLLVRCCREIHIFLGKY